MSEKPEGHQLRVAARAFGGVASLLARRPAEFRYGLAREGWSSVKRFGASGIPTVDPREVPTIGDAVIEGFIDDPNRAVVAALCRGVEARTFLEIGTNRGRTTWTVARNNPQLEEIVTIDLPPEADASTDTVLAVNTSDGALIERADLRGEAFRGTPEEERITQLWGDSATYDFSEYFGRMDVIFIDGAHSLPYVRSDTELAWKLASPEALVIWDDYPAIPSVYEVLTDLAAGVKPPPFHVRGTRLVVYSKRDLVIRLPLHRRAQVTEA
jgi:predicted O-methyltransferase YrrM